MRIIGLIFSIALLVLPLSAKVTWGVRAGGAYSSLVQKVDGEVHAGARFGFSIGGLMEVPVYKKLTFRPEVAFVNEGGTFYSTAERYSQVSFKNKCNYFSIQVPFNFAYSFNIEDVRLAVFAGPALDFSLFGTMRTKDNTFDIQFGQTEEKDLKFFDLGVSVGLDVEYKNVFFAIHTLCGTLDRYAVKRPGESAIFQNNVTFSLGYFFR